MKVRIGGWEMGVGPERGSKNKMRRHCSTKTVTDEMWSKEGRTHCRVTSEDSYLGRNPPLGCDQTISI